MVDSLEPWVACESCGRHSPPELDPYEDTILHDCAADEWIGVEDESGSVRGPYASPDGPSNVPRARKRQLTPEEAERYRERVREIYDAATAQVEARLAGADD